MPHLPRPVSNSTTTSTSPSIDDKVKRFSSFITDRLKPDLQILLERRDLIYQEIQQYTELSSTIHLIQSSQQTTLSTMVNLGSDFYVQAKVPDCSKIMVTVGLGFEVEFTLDEALTFIVLKIEQLNQRSEGLTTKAADISARIKVVYEGIAELLQLQKNTTQRPRRQMT